MNNLVIAKEDVIISPVGEESITIASGAYRFSHSPSGEVSVPSKEEKQELFTIAAQYFPRAALPHKTSSSIQASMQQYAVTPDGLPLIGRPGKESNLFVNVAHGFNPLTLAWGTSSLLVEYIDREEEANNINERSMSSLVACRPDRF